MPGGSRPHMGKVTPFSDVVRETLFTMDADLHDVWLQAIMDDDVKTVNAILDQCNDMEKRLHTSGHFLFPSAKRSEHQQEYSFCNAWHMAVAFGSRDVVRSFIQHGCDVLAVDAEGRNAIHCLVYMSFMREDIRDDMIQIFKILREKVAQEDFLRMLVQEDSLGRRPIEYTLHLGVCRLLMEMVKVRDMHLAREVQHGTTVTLWQDITDYECCRDRLFRSPVILSGLYDYQHLHDQYFDQFFFSESLTQWMDIKWKVFRPFLFIWFLFRATFMVFCYLGDKALLQIEENVNVFEEVFHPNGSFCRAGVPVPDSLGSFCVWFCLAYSLIMILSDIIENALVFARKNKLLTETPKGTKQPIVHVFFYRISQFCLYVTVFVSFVLRQLRIYEGIDVPMFFDNASYCLIIFCFIWSIMQFVQLIPFVGHFTVSLQRMFETLVLFLVLYAAFTGIFCVLFFRIINEGQDNCFAEFSNSFVIAYSTFRVLINTMDFTTLDVRDEMTLYFCHVTYVFTGSILLINYLIAMFTTIVNWTDAYRDVILRIQRLSMIGILELRVTLLADRLFRKYQMRFFQVRNGRIYVMETCSHVSLDAD